MLFRSCLQRIEHTNLDQHEYSNILYSQRIYCGWELERQQIDGCLGDPSAKQSNDNRHLYIDLYQCKWQ